MRLIDLVIKNPNFWNKWAISGNPNITLQDIENNKNIDWDYSSISYNPNITLEFVKAHLDKEWEWDFLSTLIPINDIMSTGVPGTNPDYNWSWRGMSSNPSLTDDFLVQHLKEDWDWDMIVINMPLDFIETNELWLREKSEEFDFFLSYNKNVTLEYTQSFNCVWDNFSDQGNFTFQEVLDNINLPWSWYYLSKRMNINDIINNKDLPWLWDVISEYNPTVTMTYVKNNPNLPWNKVLLQANPGITMSDINNFEIDYNSVSRNPNLTINFYLVHKTNFNQAHSYELSRNLWNLKMVKAKKELLETTLALSDLRILPPYIIEHITSWTITDPSIDLFDKIKIIDSVLKKKPLIF